jgi:amino acid transporter
MDADAARLRELGYKQELRRRLRFGDALALGIAGISPVIGLYGVVLLGTLLAGPAWIWVLPIALLGQCTLLAVYSQLAAEFPVAGGAYQWSRRLIGGAYGWLAGWVAIWAYAVANPTVAYLGAPWALALFGVEPTPRRVVFTAMVLLVLCGLAGSFGVVLLGRIVKVGISAELIASVGVGLVLLTLFHNHGFSLLTHTLGAESASSGSVGAGLLAALAVGGWVFIGFDVIVGAAEETEQPDRHIPRAIWTAVLLVGMLVLLNAAATTLAHPDPSAVVAGKDPDPISTAVVNSFGSWSDRPFDAVILAAFISGGIAAQALTARTIYSVARDDVLPASRFLRSVDSKGVPIGGTIVTIVVGCLALLLGLKAAAVGTLITFGTAAIYVSFLMTAIAALIARSRGTWSPIGRTRRGMALNVLAVGWLAFETINIAWPRKSLAPPDAPFYQVWAAPLTLAAIAVLGVAYLVVARPHVRRASVQ